MRINADVKALMLAEPMVQQHPLVIGALMEAEVIAARDGFNGVPDYDFVRVAIEAARPTTDKWSYC